MFWKKGIIGLLLIIPAAILFFIFDQSETATANSEAVSAGKGAKTKVYLIESVKKNPAGKPVDITWTENGKKMTFSELTKNKVVFLNVWGTWCPPCRRELPDIISIDKDNIKDLIVISVSAFERYRGADAKINAVTKFAKQIGIEYRVLVSSDQQFERLNSIHSVPTTYIIDRDGNVGETMVGMRDKTTFMKAINRILKK